MTKSQRAQVVELLRCVWDQRDADRIVSCPSTGELLGAPRDVIHIAIAARNYVAMDRCDAGLEPLDSYHDECLEAAARVEEKSWP